MVGDVVWLEGRRYVVAFTEDASAPYWDVRPGEIVISRRLHCRHVD
jgi:hypothetical protein